MEKTENYQLNQWDAADPIRREDFNADNAKLDAALAAIQQTAEGAMETAQEGVAKGTAAMAAAEKNCMVKLKEGSITAETSTIHIDLSDVDLSQYQKLILEVYGRTTNVNGTTALTLRLNNNSSAVYYHYAYRNLLEQMTISDQGRYVRTSVEITGIEEMVAIRWESITSVSGASGYSTSAAGMTTLCGMKDITSIQLLVDQLYHYMAGSWYKLYGVLE